MTQSAVSIIPKSKLNSVKELTNLIKNKRTILVADIGNIPGAQFQQIGKKLRGQAVVKVPKKNLLFRAIDNSGKKTAQGLKELIKGPVALLFSDLDSYELAALLLKNKSPAKAKPGQIAPMNIEIPAGPTDLVPGPAISELGALGIQIMIQGGKIEIKESKVVAQEGKAISQGAADMLSKLNILPFTIGFSPVCAYDSQDDLIYLEIKIDSEGAINSLKESYSRALSFAVNIGYTSKDTIRLMLAKANAYERKLIRVINGEPEEVVVAPAQEEKKEDVPQEKKEENASNTDALAGFF